MRWLLLDIQLSFVLDKEVPDGGHLLWLYNEGYIEGLLDIYQNEKLFFQEPYVNLAEFGIELGKWFRKVQSGLRENMKYETIEHDEAIIDFFYEGNEQWRIFSIWQKFESTEYAGTTSLVDAVERYLRQLNDELHEIRYPITLDEFLISVSQLEKGNMKFQILRFHWWYILPISFVDAYISDRFHLDQYHWFIQWLFFPVIWGSLLWLWNLLRPRYLILGNLGVSVGKVFYHINKIESILVSKSTRGVTFIPKRKKSSPIFITLRKTQQGRVYDSIKQWADVHGISIIIR